MNHLTELIGREPATEDALEWPLNHSLDLVVQAFEMVEDLEGAITGLQAYEQLLGIADTAEAEQMGRVWAALAMVARSVLDSRGEAQHGHA